MKDLGIRYGSAAFGVPVVVMPDAVYVHTDIVKVERQDEAGRAGGDTYQYHEYVYTPEEYIQMIGGENAALKKELESVSGELTNTQLALTEVYELLAEGGAV